jgi:hypothetical protein
MTPRRATLVALLLRRGPQWQAVGSGTKSAARGVASVSLIVLGAAGALAEPVGAPLTGTAGAATTVVPYTDPNAVGSIGLCNQAGQQITSGSISTSPFAWRAVSTEPAQPPYNNAGRTATLVAFQPQQALPAGDWSGAEMTSSSSYTNPANPMAAATGGDQSLQSFVEQYPPKWDGFVQLRMYLSTANHQPYEAQYPTLNIQVTGTTWQAVGGSSVNCASGTAESIETMLLPPSTTSTTSKPSPTTTSASGSGTGKGASVGGTQGSDADSSRGGVTSGGSALAAGTGKVAADTEPSDLPIVLGIILAVLVVFGAAFSLVLHRRRRASTQLASDSSLVSPSASSSSTKGDTP